MVNYTADASGAWQAGKQGHVVVIVDIIDMSTTLEVALEAGALAVFGASPDYVKVPHLVNPRQMGRVVGRIAGKLNTSIVIINEPRWGNNTARLSNCQNLLQGLQSMGIYRWESIPNLGSEVGELINFQNKIAVAVTHSGGVAFDAAFQAGGKVITATIARTKLQKGSRPAEIGVKRALLLAKKLRKNITFVAASGQSLEDILAAQYLAELALIKRK
ncbi:MAG: hypothetical protein WDA53_06950 [Bacillota bacterium]